MLSSLQYLPHSVNLKYSFPFTKKCKSFFEQTSSLEDQKRPNIQLGIRVRAFILAQRQGQLHNLQDPEEKKIPGKSIYFPYTSAPRHQGWTIAKNLIFTPRHIWFLSQEQDGVSNRDPCQYAVLWGCHPTVAARWLLCPALRAQEA